MKNLKPSLLLGFAVIVLFSCDQKKCDTVLISTEYGDMKIRFFEETPKHRDNFIKLVKEGFYNDLLFHRVINGFMIQGGDPDSKNAEAGEQLGNGGPGYQIDAEFNANLFHKKGVLAAAREGDNMNPEKKSSGSQFYIVQGQKFSTNELKNFLKDNTPQKQKAYTTIGGTPHLDGNYTVFGEVIEGLEVIDKIAAVKTDKNDRPVKDVRMTIKLVK